MTQVPTHTPPALHLADWMHKCIDAVLARRCLLPERKLCVTVVIANLLLKEARSPLGFFSRSFMHGTIRNMVVPVKQGQKELS